MKRFASSAAALFVLLGLAALASADAEADKLKAKMVEAYKNAKTYQSTIRFELVQTEGRWTTTQATFFKVAFDREGGKVTIDKPDFYVVVDGGKMKLKTEQIESHYVDADAPKPMTMAALSKENPYLSKPPLLDMVMLLSDDPLFALTGDKDPAATFVAPDANDPDKRPGLQFKMPQGKVTLRVDPATGLVTSAHVGADDKSTGFNYRFETEKYNQPLDAKAFAFDAGTAKPVESLEALMMAAQQAQQGGGGGGQPKHALEGEAAPPIALKNADGKDWKLADEKAEVIVLDFWATWCPPCRKGLPKIQEVADWAKANKKSVAVYAVNVQEPAEKAQGYFTENKLTMPILLDTEGDIGQAYGVQGIPQTVVIAKGKVVRVLVGFDPEEAEELKAEIDELLKAPAAN